MKKTTSETFLSDEIGRTHKVVRLGLMDGFRFGIGFTVAILFILVIITGISWAAITFLG